MNHIFKGKLLGRIRIFIVISYGIIIVPVFFLMCINHLEKNTTYTVSQFNEFDIQLLKKNISILENLPNGVNYERVVFYVPAYPGFTAVTALKFNVKVTIPSSQVVCFSKLQIHKNSENVPIYNEKEINYRDVFVNKIDDSISCVEFSFFYDMRLQQGNELANWATKNGVRNTLNLGVWAILRLLLISIPPILLFFPYKALHNYIKGKAYHPT